MNFAGINYCGLLLLKSLLEETFAERAKNYKTAKFFPFKVPI